MLRHFKRIRDISGVISNKSCFLSERVFQTINNRRHLEKNLTLYFALCCAALHYPDDVTDGRSGTGQLHCLWSNTHRYPRSSPGIVTVGQRKKVTAVTFFRCPTVIMVTGFGGFVPDGHHCFRSRLRWRLSSGADGKSSHLGPLLLTWSNLNLTMDK